jgi:putative ABC transport system permease protein
VIGLRLAGLAIGATLRPTRDSSHVAAFLAIRDISRRQPSALRQLLPVTAAVVLAVFAVSSWALAAANRYSVAAFDVGAAQVVDVLVRRGVNLEAAVRQADPSGTWAMAAALSQSKSGNLLALDASRLAAVAAWPTGLSGQSAITIGRYLSPKAPPPIEFAGPSLRAVISVTPKAPAINVRATVFNELTESESAFDIPVSPGTVTYSLSLQGFCDSTCRLVNLSPSAAAVDPLGPPTVDLTLKALSVGSAGNWRDIAFGAGAAGSWNVSPSDIGFKSGAPGAGVTFILSASDLGGQGILLSPSYVPNPIPAVVTYQFAASNTPAPPDNAQPATGLDENVVTVAGQIQVPTLPEIGDDAAVIDLSFAQLAMVAPSTATFQVWLSADAPASILQRLNDLGVSAQSFTSAADKASALGTTPLALAYTFGLYAAMVAAVLATGSTAFGILAAGKRRLSDLRDLRAAGVRRQVVIRSALLENGLVLAIALAIGGIVGVIASQLALASLPEFSNGTGGVPISHAIQVLPLAALLAALALLFAATALITTWLTFPGAATDAPAEEQ